MKFFPISRTLFSFLALATVFALWGSASCGSVDPMAGLSNPDLVAGDLLSLPGLPPLYDSGNLSSFGAGQEKTYTINPCPTATDTVKLQLNARADLSGNNKFVTLLLNNYEIQTNIFAGVGGSCPNVPNEANILVPASAFNAIVGAAHVATFRMVASSGVNANSCGNNNPSFISIHVDMCTGTDCNNNGLRDSCDLYSGTSHDCNTNNTPDECDIAGGGSHDTNDSSVPDECELDIISVEPNTGNFLGGTRATVHGHGFTSEAKVRFGGQLATDIDVADSETINVTTPQGEVGPVEVSVEDNINGQITATLIDGFAYVVTDDDDGTDTDQDGLTDVTELRGWEVWVDAFGLGLGVDTFGNVTRTAVFSDPYLADTDGDGLGDAEEYFNKSNPMVRDSDGDGLWDGEEAHRWHTSPISVDSDHDARGPEGNLPPVAALFDGLELYTPEQLLLPPSQRGPIKANATSPTLDDTDGDGKTDFEEITNSTRNPLISDLPKVEIEIVDNIDIRLDTEFAEEVGQTKEFSTTLTTSTTHTNSSTESQSLGAEVGAAYTMGVEAGFPNGVSVTQSAEFHVNVSTEHVWESSHETSTMTQSEFAKSQAESLTKTETSATGSMTMGVRIRNAGNIAFRLTNLGYTVRQWVPHYDPGTPTNIGEFRTLATLALADALQNGVTLGPLEQSPVLQVSATEVNASRIKEFLARPRSLFFEPAYFDLENAEGLNYAFVREVTFARTAELAIDYGNGATENYRVATNVDRDQDGNFKGVKITDLLTNLGIEYNTAVQHPSGDTVLTKVRHVPDPNQPPPADSFWAVILSGPRFEDGAVHGNLEDLVLHSGERAQLVYTRDDDGDGLLLAEEVIYGTSDHAIDSDGDGINDIDEVRAHFVNGQVIFGGWDVTVQGNGPYHLFSDPANGDADDDGFNDSQERTNGTDPFKKDTDEDGLEDNVDPAPLITARILYVKQDAVVGGDGSGWAAAFNKLENALNAAQSANGNANLADDVSQVWVAAGAYSPPAGFAPTTISGGVKSGALAQPLLGNPYFVLPNRTSVYGGFAGDETKLAQRNPDPLTNGTSLNSIGGYTIQQSSGTVVLDGFSLQNSTIVPAVNITGGKMTVRNCLFVNNMAGPGQASCMSIEAGTHTLENCTFAINRSLVIGSRGAMSINNANVTFNGCSFFGNVVDCSLIPAAGAAIYAKRDVGAEAMLLTFEGCRFDDNVINLMLPGSTANGGAVHLERCSGHFRNCVFDGNKIKPDDNATWAESWTPQRAGGAVAITGSGKSAFVNCLFKNNSAQFFGGAVYVNSTGTADVLNCTFSGNLAGAHGTHTDFGSCVPYGVGAAIGSLGTTRVVNTIAYGNIGRYKNSNGTFGDIIGMADTHIAAGVVWNNLNICASTDTGTTFVSYSAVQDLGSRWSPRLSVGIGNTGADPLLSTDGSLAEGSPAIDNGNKFVDSNPFTAGLQPLPNFDLREKARFADGNGDGVEEVDMGCFEFQGSN